jgi:RNA recognition motif-containing protein
VRLFAATPCSLLSLRRDVAADHHKVGLACQVSKKSTVQSSKELQMSTNLFVGNLTFGTTNGELETMFAAYGDVTRAQVITDRDTGRSRGFGFVEMASSDAAEKAISSLDGKDVSGRQIKVNVAKPRSS